MVTKETTYRLIAYGGIKKTIGFKKKPQIS